MSDENYPERIIVEKLTQFGEALQGKLMGQYIFPPNFPGKKITDKIDELIAIVEEKSQITVMPQTDFDNEVNPSKGYYFTYDV
jgi:hypothetical protein